MSHDIKPSRDQLLARIADLEAQLREASKSLAVLREIKEAIKRQGHE
jgi:hypothetical protein